MGMDTYPKDSTMFNETFTDDQSCLEYLFKLRWPAGYVCPKCDARDSYWRLDNGKVKCRKCHHVHSILSGTVFQGAHTPLLEWFRILWHFCLRKNGYSALSLHRTIARVLLSCIMALPAQVEEGDGAPRP